MNDVPRILIVEDQSDDYELAQREVRKALKNCVFQRVETRKEYLKALKTFEPDLILSDYSLPNFNGMQALKLATERAPLTPLVIWTGSISEDTAVDCMKAGAVNYVLKENIKRLAPAVVHALEERRLFIERKQVEDELRASEARFRTFVNYASDAFFLHDDKGIILDVNHQACESLGYTREELIGMTPFDFDADATPGFVKQIGAHLNAGEMITFDTRYRRKDGTTFPVEVRIRSFEENGQHLGISLVRDITQRKRVEERLQTSESRYRLATQATNDVIWEWSPETNQLTWNENAQIVFGYSPEEIGPDASWWDEHIHSEDRERVTSKLNTLAATVGGESVWSDEYRFLLKNGSYAYINDHAYIERDSAGQTIRMIGAMSNITERKKVEEELAKSEKRFRALIENGLDDISLLAPDGTLLWESPSTVRNLGYPPDTFTGHNIFELMHPDDLEWSQKLYQKLAQEAGSREQGMFRLRHSNGTWRWMEAIATNMLNEPSVKAIVINYRDITERKEAADALRESQIKYQNLVETSHDLIWSVDTDGRITFLNGAAKDIYGYEPEELIGRFYFDLLDPEHHHTNTENFKETIASRNEYQGNEIYVRHRDGRQIILSANSIVMQDENGNMTGVTGSSHDITLRKRVEEVLRDERNLLRTLIDNLPDRIYAMDMQGRKTLSNIADWKASGGKTREDVIGKTDFDMYPPELAEPFWQVDKTVLESGQPIVNYEEPGLDSEGNLVSLLTTKIPLRAEEGKVIGLVSTGRDITERKRAEEKLLRSQQELTEAQRVAKIGSWSFDPVKNEVHWSDELYRIFGIEREGFVHTYETFVDLIHPEDRFGVNLKNKDALEKGKSFDIEYRIITPGGELKYISEIGDAVTNSDGKITSLFGTAQDITQRKQTEMERQVLLEIMQGLGNASDLQDFLKLIHHAIAKVTYAENFFVVFHHPDSDLFEEIYSVDQYDPPAPASRLEKGITSYVYRSGEPLLLTQERFNELVEQEEIELVGTNSASWLGVPLKTSNGTLGVIAVQDYENPNRYSEHDKEFLASIASQVALAIERKQADIELQQKNDDLALLNIVNEAVVRGQNLDSIVELLSQELKRIFSTVGSTIYTLSPDKQSIIMQQYSFSPEIAQRIEKLLGFTIPRIEIPIKEGGYFYKAMTSKRSAITSEPQEIQNWIAEFAETKSLPSMTKAIVRKLIPQIHKLLNIKSTIVVPLISGEETIGFLDVSGSSLFTSNDLKRIEHIGAQLTAVIQRQKAETAEREQRILAEALRDTSQTLSSTLDYGEVLDHILTTVGRVVPHDAATITLIDEGFAHVVRSLGYDKHTSNREIMGVKLPLVETTNLRQMLETKQPVVVYDTHSYMGWKRLGATDWLRSNVGAPILIYGEVIGFILLDSQIPGFFTPAHAERLEAFANQAALAIHNARLLQQAREEIAERKRAEEELRQSENRYRTVVESQTEFIVRWKPNGVRTFVNDTYCRYFGVTPEHALSTGFMPLVYEEDRQSVEEKISRLLSGITTVETDSHRVLKQDGGIGWNEWTDHAIYDENGQLIEFQSVGRDITERKQAEQDLLASEERFRQLANNIEEAFWMTDAETGKEIYISPAGEKIWGRSLDYLMREPDAFMEIILPEDKSDVSRSLEKEKHGEKVEMEYRIQHPDGSVHWIWDRAFPIFDKNGNVKALAGVAADITERKQAEEALRESEERFSSAFEFAPIGIALISLDGHWLKVNHALSDLIGYTEQELKAKTFQEITHPEDLDADLNYVDKMLTGEITSYQMEKRYFHKSGNIVWVLLSVSLVRDGEGKSQYFIAQIQDISQRKRTTEEISRRAQETAALLETSLALTNLDLNAILQSIGNSAKSLFIADGCRIFLMQPDGESLRCVLALQEDSFAFTDLRLKLGEGVTGAVAATGKAEIVNEMQNDPRGIQVPGTQEAEAEAIMFAPLKERDRTIGVLSIRRAGAERPFQTADLELLEAFAAMAASAVSNARLFEETQRRLAELEALYENGLAVGQLLEPRGIGERVIETFARYLSWHHVTIRLLRSETDELELIAFNLPGLNEEQKIEMENHFNKMIHKIGQGLSGEAAQSGIRLRTGNVLAHAQYVDTQADIQSGLYMPMKIGDRVIGVISVESETPDAFTEQDERLLATLANQAAIAFENARLYQAAHEEILERTRAQAALWASETHYRELADSITDVLFELDNGLRFTHWNKASEMLTGIPEDDAIGKSMYEIFGSSEEQFKIGKIYESVLTNRQARTFETEIFVKGQKLAFEINAYPSTRGVSVVARDVTERKLSETLMQKRIELMEYAAHHSLEELLQKTIDEISVLTDSHIGFLHFVEEDQESLSLQAWSSETIQAMQKIKEQGMHYPIDSAGVWADAVRQRQSLIHNDYESLPNKKGLPENHVQMSRELVIPIIRDEKIVAVLGVGNRTDKYVQHDIETAERFADYAWDITERKQMESALADERNQLARRVEERTADLSRANSSLARALRVKDEFLANMSHELRTPLNAILGLSESLSEQVAGPLNEKQQKYLNTINESGHHLLSLINDILDLAKIEAGQITLDINKVDVNSVCQASLRMIKQLAQKKNQEVMFEIDSDLGLMWADERRLKQMIVNLLSNAVKFTPEAGKLGLEVRGDHAGNRVLLTVWDKGIGISDADLDRLFKPFVQLDSGLAREATGTGLGLALVAQMARLHGGSVSVDSQIGDGSRFTIQLPWEPALAADASTRLKSTGKFYAIDPNALNKPTILLIEDTREVVMMLVDYLEMTGFKMVTAQDGIDGLEQAKLTHPDLVLMDIQMPRMDGFETTQKLRMNPEFKDTPIIALTALAMPNDRQRCLDAGMDEYISKPVNLKALVKLIRSILLVKEETKTK